MGDLSNLVDEGDDAFLENLSANTEVMDDTETDNNVCLLAGHHWVEVTTGRDILGDNCRTGFSKAKGEEMTNLLNCLLQDGGFHVLINLSVALFL